MIKRESDSRRAAQHRQYLKRKANGTQKKTKSGTQCKNQVWRNTADYRAWREVILSRGHCEITNCNSTTDLQAHHIKSAASFPELRFDISNGMCICSTCHKNVK